MCVSDPLAIFDIFFGIRTQRLNLETKVVLFTYRFTLREGHLTLLGDSKKQHGAARIMPDVGAPPITQASDKKPTLLPNI